MENLTFHNYYKKKKTDRDIFQDLMPFKVKEILLVSNLYDAYSITREGQFFDRIFGEYLQLNLYAAPRITSALSDNEALLKIQYNNFDVVILTAGMDKKAPLLLAEKIKKSIPDTPIILLVNNNSDLKYFKLAGGKSKNIERVFVWNGESKIFLAISKYIEDKKNVAPDTQIGDVRVILLVEDSVRYYSRYLPLLYSIVMKQTQEIIQDYKADESQKILKMRARPKILLCTTYEEAITIVNRYQDNLLCVISDVSFNKDNRSNPDAGVQLLKYVQEKTTIPLLMQSSNSSNQIKAESINVNFIHKSSETLAHDIQEFLLSKCGFGDFVFKDRYGKPFDKATNLVEFEEKIHTLPVDSFYYHGRRQGFSIWLMARGEINLAQMLRPVNIDEYEDLEVLRSTVLEAFRINRLEKLKGNIVNFHPSLIHSKRYIVRLGNGSLGGKGRGMAFLSNFIENLDFNKLLPDIRIAIPTTSVIGVEAFDTFLETNGIYDQIYADIDFMEIQSLFVNSQLSDDLVEKLRHIVNVYKKPLAVRSSGLFEDSMQQPFSGVYRTYILPNNQESESERLNQLCLAIKLVYASIFTDSARNYFQAVNYKIEEEKMAVIIQELVGTAKDQYYYTQISGVAQSYNYYPFSYMQPEDGFSVAAIGLGMYVVGGEKSHRFCPRYPKLELNAIPDQVKDSQTHFYAVDLKKQNIDLINEGEDAAIVKLPLKIAESEGNLLHMAEVFDFENQRLIGDFTKRGPRVVNFSNILKYDHIPLAKTLKILLNFFEEAMGTPVEIEYAVDMNLENDKLPTFYLLQIKPLIQKEYEVDLNLEEYNPDDAILYASKGMGNGQYSHIKDVIYMDIDKFEKTETGEMAKEMRMLNKLMVEEDREYILIGPGRWGTRDKFTGIPVLWSHISKARVIIEMGLKDFPLDASLGSHFFHNVTSMNVGYFSVPHRSPDNKLNLDKLSNAEVINQTHYFKHVRFKKSLHVIMDGRKRKALIMPRK